MSFSREITLWCDAEGCLQWTGASESTVASARTTAKRAWGWRYVNTYDFCPEHARLLPPISAATRNRRKT